MATSLFHVRTSTVIIPLIKQKRTSVNLDVTYLDRLGIGIAGPFNSRTILP